MKILIVCYSRTGLTKKIATIIANKVDAQHDEVIDKKDRSGSIGFVTAGRDATLKKLTEIEFKCDPEKYDLIIIGGPVWAWTMSSAIRTYLIKNKDILKTKKLAFFATQGSDGAEKKFLAMKEIIGVDPIARLIINAKDFRTNDYNTKVEEFTARL